MARDSEATLESMNRALTGVKPVSARRQLVNVGDRVFYLVARSLALLVIVLAFLLVADLFRGASESIRQFGLKFLIGTTWDPVAHQFSTLPTVIGTLVKGFIALLLAVPVSIGSAIFIPSTHRVGFGQLLATPSNCLRAYPVSSSACGHYSRWCRWCE